MMGEGDRLIKRSGVSGEMGGSNGVTEGSNR